MEPAYRRFHLNHPPGFIPSMAAIRGEPRQQRHPVSGGAWCTGPGGDWVGLVDLLGEPGGWGSSQWVLKMAVNHSV
ncbi:hypothetical protein NHX12_009554 [Muraenolepis orangiensis]|uniref:Uncharacterized protein n=1 Tax=Muraenolepis orangiensis TaxID=630683 RepID=A0A9Q0I813_9TELE|nr:hypothetical protein NHX12_009554 [Muraenolepis orangiensis]